MDPIQFDLHKLGWKAFEDLVSCILRETLGQTFQIFADGPDGGRDGAFYGTWTAVGTDAMSGSFAVQCKHTSKPNANLTVAIVEEELPKIARLSEKGLADAYLLFTNCSVSAEATAEMEERMRKAGAKFAKIYSAKWINQSISTRPSLRRLVPRIYGLGDLTQIVTHQAFRQAQDVLDSISKDLACFVPTDAYRKCAHALKEHGFVMLIGEPASGKSMIADLLALSAADEWDLQTLILSCPQDLDTSWNPDDPGQFFWVDDAFGSNHCDFNRVHEWNQRLPKLKAAIHKGARVIFTSRSYIYRAAQARLNSNKFELFNDNRVTIEVEKLSEAERAMILYNHLKLGKQTQDFRKRVKGFLPSAVGVPKFLPEVARRFADPAFTSTVSLSQSGVVGFFSEPVGVMAEVIKGLAPAERAALALVYASGGSLPIPVPSDDPRIASIITSMQSNLGDVKAALASLDDSMLKSAKVQDDLYWQFRHPTIRDAFATDVASNPELVEIYLSGVTKDRLVEEISCGDMGIEGVKLIVPRALFGRVLAIIAPGSRAGSLTGPVLSFLATRCSDDFLRMFFDEEPTREHLVGQMYSTNKFESNLAILVRLNCIGILGEELRQKVLKRLGFLAEVDHSDCFVDGDFVGTLLSQEENAKLLAAQKDVLYSNMHETVREIEDAWNVDDDVDDAFYEVARLLDRLRDVNESLRGEDGYDEKERNKLEAFRKEVETKKVELKRRQSDAADYEELETEEAPEVSLPSGRSIFDDVDE